LLECIKRKDRKTVNPSDLESDVYAVNESIMRYCKRCGSSTLWKCAGGDANDKSVPPKSEQRPQPSESPAPSVPTRPENRRKHLRTKVNFTACVRRAGFDDDIVVCEDMSKGGLRFKSQKRYFEMSTIEVAVPYSPGSVSIFVPAQIVYVQEIAKQKLFRYGVAYVRTRENFESNAQFPPDALPSTNGPIPR
jgi:hypothetical protein